MLPTADIGRYCCAAFTNVDNYRAFVGDELIDELQQLARDLRDVRLCHVNSTGFGGGVAELLSRLVPLARALGLSADWRFLHGAPEFFVVTKTIHNALQGSAASLSPSEQALYLGVNARSAELFSAEYDVVIVHDPQPAALRHFMRDSRLQWIWRCHIDSSRPNLDVAQFLIPYVEQYDAVVFTMPEFVLPGLRAARLEFIPPAIDPLSTKNMELPPELCREVVADSGVSPNSPLLLQVSRFDPWKDPMGVIDVYRRVKRAVPEVQLALVGAVAGDDPEGWNLLAQAQDAAATDPDLYVFTNLAGVGNMEVNAFQRAADVVIQKSTREGFGLVVSEALWKGKPTVAGRAGGIPMQFPGRYEKYLVSSTEECADGVLGLLESAEERAAFGRAGREHIRRNFLLPRLLRDELRLVKDVAGGSRP